MSRVFAGVLLLFPLWLAAPRAREPSPEGDQSSRVRPTKIARIKRPLIAWTMAVAADQVTTYQFSRQYQDLIHEKNPLIRGLDGHPAWLVGAGAAMDASSAWLAYRLLRHHPRLVRAIFYSASAYRAYLVVHNIQMIRQADALRANALRQPFGIISSR